MISNASWNPMTFGQIAKSWIFLYRPQSEFDQGLFNAVIAIGNPTIRERVDKQMPEGTQYETLVHPRAYATRWAKLGEGSIVCAGSIISVHAGDRTALPDQRAFSGWA